MDNLEPEPGFYESNGYGVYGKHLLHHATVSILYIYIYSNDVILRNKIYL